MTKTPLLLYSREVGFSRSRDEAMRNEVKSVHNHSGLTNTTSAIKTRIAKVTESLATGERLYAKDADTPTADQGGLLADRKVQAEARLREVEIRSDQEFSELVSKWEEKFPPVNTLGPITPGLINDLGLDPTIVFPAGPCCTFCGKSVEEVHATHGRRPLRKVSVTEEIIVAGKLITTTKIVHTTDKQLACPDCCLKITDTMFKSQRT